MTFGSNSSKQLDERHKIRSAGRDWRAKKIQRPTAHKVEVFIGCSRLFPLSKQKCSNHGFNNNEPIKTECARKEVRPVATRRGADERRGCGDASADAVSRLDESHGEAWAVVREYVRPLRRTRHGDAQKTML